MRNHTQWSSSQKGRVLRNPELKAHTHEESCTIEFLQKGGVLRKLELKAHTLEESCTIEFLLKRTTLSQINFSRLFYFKEKTIMLSKFLKSYFVNANTISSVINYDTGDAQNSSEYSDLSEIGYQKNVIVYRCVHLIARSVASVSWLLKQYHYEKKVDESLHNHEILDLFERPNSRQSRASFMETAVSHLLLSGNCYVQALRNDDQKVRELHILRPDRVRVVPGERSSPLGYEYNVGNQHKLFFKADENGFSDIFHIKLFNPLNDWYGQSPVSVAINAIKQHNAIASQNMSFLENGGRPSGALIYRAGLDTSQKMALRDDIKNAYAGGRNAGRILLLEGDFEWREMGLSPKDLDFVSGKELSAKEIALAFGVPSILIGATSDATFSNYKEARYNFWEETVIPLLNTLSGDITNWFRYLFNTDEYTITYDIDSIQALSKRRESEWNKINDANFLTIDE
jgi:HK97 family phage portal protein